MNKIALLVFTSGLLACGGGSKSDTSTMANPCAVNPCAVNPCEMANTALASKSGVDFSGFSSWTQIDQTFHSKHPGKPWAGIFVQPEHAETYKALSGDMPEGMAIVKTIHSGDASSAVKMLTVMVKMGSDYDPDNGNWYYAAMSADGTKVMNEGKMESCSNCHSSGKDYLFGTPK